MEVPADGSNKALMSQLVRPITYLYARVTQKALHQEPSSVQVWHDASLNNPIQVSVMSFPSQPDTSTWD